MYLDELVTLAKNKEEAISTGIKSIEAKAINFCIGHLLLNLFRK